LRPVITRHILTIPGTGRRVHYRKCGTGPLLLMIHQSPRSSAEYEPLMREWGAHFTCVAPDTPGFGQSDPLPGEPEIGDFANALEEFLGALGVERCAAYGFHSGGIILVAALKRHPARFSALAIGGYAIWTDEEMRVFGERYLPPFEPAPYGEHLTWLWNRMLEQSWFFPWFDVRDEARLSVAHSDIDRVHSAVMEVLDAGDAYRAGYGAVLRAPRDIPSPNAVIPPVLITAYKGDPLEAHIARLSEMPSNWSARSVADPAEHHAESLTFLRQYAAGSAPDLAEDPSEGWLPLGGGLIHWRGQRGGKRLVLHEPASELAEPGSDEIAVDAPGHGLSSAFSDIGETIDATRDALRAREIIWPTAPPGDPDQLYPDLTPDRFGAHLLRAWSAARAEVLFRPWYVVDKNHAVGIDPAALAPEAIALRARARLRAGDAARRYHDYLATRSGDPA
jgi:haloalkane dehalogenase